MGARRLSLVAVALLVAVSVLVGAGTASASSGYLPVITWESGPSDGNGTTASIVDVSVSGGVVAVTVSYATDGRGQGTTNGYAQARWAPVGQPNTWAAGSGCQAGSAESGKLIADGVTLTWTFTVPACAAAPSPFVFWTNMPWAPVIADIGSVPVPYCSSGDFASAAASYSGAVLAVRFTWSRPVPAGGWRVYAPDPGGTLPPSPTMVVPETATVEGAPGVFYATASVPSLATYTARIVAPDASAAAPGCYVSLPVSSNPISATGPGPLDPGAGAGTATDPTTGTACGAWWNLGCQIRSAVTSLFVPSSSAQEWQALADSARTRAPVSIVVGGVGWFQAIWDALSVNPGTCNVVSADTSGQCRTGLLWMDGQSSLDLLSVARDWVTGSAIGQVLFRVLELAVWVPALLWMWHRLARSVGGREASGGD